ncbi:MAG: glycosyltransferase family 4 protein [Flavobacteriales bacterium]|nr:glycosyltransferase family 4 protein [Flavobacteriales bacterium]
MRILFLVPYPVGHAPSQRFRFEQYLGTLEQHGFEYRIDSFLSEKAWKHFYRKGHVFTKALGFLSGYFRRLRMLMYLHRYDYVFVHRELAPMGLPLLSFLIARVWKSRIIYDFDDAIWLTNYSRNNKSFAWLKSYGNIKRLMGRSWKNACGNEWLRSFALQYNSQSFYLPTTLDLRHSHTKVKSSWPEVPVVGWTGSHTTISYLRDIIPDLLEVHQEQPFTLVVISNQPPEFDFPGMIFIKWNAESEVDDLFTIDIGLMPLPDTDWANGKCGLKALQYMALGIVPVVSNVGVNKEFIEHGKTGLLVQDGEWKNTLLQLLNTPDTVRRISAQTRHVIEDRFSVEANASKFLHLFAQTQ